MDPRPVSLPEKVQRPFRKDQKELRNYCCGGCVGERHGFPGPRTTGVGPSLLTPLRDALRPDRSSYGSQGGRPYVHETRGVPDVRLQRVLRYPDVLTCLLRVSVKGNVHNPVPGSS